MKLVGHCWDFSLQGAKLCAAAYASSLESVKHLLTSASNEDVNYVMGEGTEGTVLMLASQQGHIDIVKVLLADVRVIVNMQNKVSSTKISTYVYVSKTWRL